MPQKDMSSQIGKSSSPVVQKVIDNNKNGQAVVPTNSATAPGVSYQKQPVKE